MCVHVIDGKLAVLFVRFSHAIPICSAMPRPKWTFSGEGPKSILLHLTLASSCKIKI